MKSVIVINSTENLLSYKGVFVKVIPTEKLSINFKMSPRKGCGLVVKSV